MNYKDAVYGDFEISEPIILDLINSPSVQRLKEIDQAGYFEPFFPGSKHSRFEHSIGVYLLLKKYGASIEEQISGLIHDVSHPAFSHCIDYVLDAGSGKKQNYQDNIFEEFVNKSEIPRILEKYGFDLNYILDDEDFILKERNLPDLCADRIDYSLRDALAFKEISDASYFVDNIMVIDSKWVFKDFESADKYSNLFLKMNTTYYSGMQSAVMFLAIGDYLKYALSKGHITEADLHTTDGIVLNKIEPYINSDAKLSLLFDRLNNRIGYKNDPDNYDGKVFCKSRVIDLLCLHDGAIKRFSEIKPSWNDVIKREAVPKEYFLKFDK